MTVYRLTSARFPRCDGEGARLYGRRWNSKGRAVIYTAATQSLAALEILAHAAALGDDYIVIAIEVPDDIESSELHHSQLTDWELTTTRQFGDQWVENTSTAVLKVPSKVIPAEANYILNPAHPDFPRCRIGNPKLFYFEERLLERFMGVMPR